LSADRNRSLETVVIGGGVIGLTVAYELARRGNKVIVLERDQPGAGATTVAAGMLAPISEAEHEESERTRLALDSKARYPEFVAELERVAGLSCDYRAAGTLWVAANRDEAAELRCMAETLAAKSLPFDRLSAAEVLDREPHLSGRVVGGLFLKADHHIDPRLLTCCLVAAVEKLGGVIRTGVNVRELDCRAQALRAVVAETEAGERLEIACARAVLAAGAWSTHLITSPVSDLGVRPVKGQMIHLRGARLLQHVIRTPEVYFVPRDDGELLVGSTMEEQGFNDAPSAGGVLDILRHAWQVLPGIYDLDFTEVSAGFRPAVQDHFPVVGPSQVEGLYLALGHFRSGILLAPATAHYLAECMQNDRLPAELEPFQAARLRAQVTKSDG